MRSPLGALVDADMTERSTQINPVPPLSREQQTSKVEVGGW